MNEIIISGQKDKYIIRPNDKKCILQIENAYGRFFIGEKVSNRDKVFIKHFTPTTPNDAVKVLLLLQEQLIKDIHPYIANTLEIIAKDKLNFFVVKEYIEGISLQNLLKKYSFFMSIKKKIYFMKIIKNILLVLDALHKKDIIHCDINPSSIIIEKKQNNFESPNIKIIDFSLLKTSQLQLSSNVKIRYQVKYSSPEAQLGYYDLLSYQSDLYSIGIILFEAYYGRHPFAHTQTAIIRAQHLSSPLPTLKTKDDALLHIINKATYRQLFEKPAHFYDSQTIKEILLEGIRNRYQNAKEMLVDVENYILLLQSRKESWYKLSNVLKKIF